MKNLTSYIGEGVALPHARVKMKRPYALAVGRCPAGLAFEGKDSYEDIRFVFLLLASEKAKNYLSFLASLARAFQDSSVMDQLWMARDNKEFKDSVRKAFVGADDRPARRRTKFNKLLTDEASKIAKAAECSTILVFTDVFPPTLAPRMTFPGFKVVLAGESVSDEDRDHHRADATLAVRTLSRSRLSQLRAAILLGLTRGIFGFQDRVCCVGGIPRKRPVRHRTGGGRGRGIRVRHRPRRRDASSWRGCGALERLTAIATDLATAGREGKSIGAMFILGDHEEVIKRSKQLVLNPFHGYGAEDRSILNPFMDETIKELALIDGAFIVPGDGVVESAGCLIQARADEVELPGGLGTRHAAAAAITHATDSLGFGGVLLRTGHLLPQGPHVHPLRKVGRPGLVTLKWLPRTTRSALDFSGAVSIPSTTDTSCSWTRPCGRVNWTNSCSAPPFTLLFDRKSPCFPGNNDLKWSVPFARNAPNSKGSTTKSGKPGPATPTRHCLKSERFTPGPGSICSLETISFKARSMEIQSRTSANRSFAGFLTGPDRTGSSVGDRSPAPHRDEQSLGSHLLDRDPPAPPCRPVRFRTRPPRHS